MASDEIKYFSDIVAKVLARTRQPSTEEAIVSDIKGFINDKYVEIIDLENWRWMRKPRQLIIKGKYQTGTAAVTNGSRQVVFTGSSIDDLRLNWKFKVNGDAEAYRIVAVDDATDTVMLDAAYIGSTNATAGFTLYKDEYGMFPDFEELDDSENFYRTTGIHLVGPSKIIELRNRFPNKSGRVSHMSIDGDAPYDGITMGEFLMGYDFMGIPSSKKVVVFPSIQDNDQIIPITYTRRFEPLVNDSDEPLMPISDRIALVHGAAALWFATQSDTVNWQVSDRDYTKKVMQMQADNQETDDQTQLLVSRKYDRPLRRPTQHRGLYVGTAFDRDED